MKIKKLVRFSRFLLDLNNPEDIKEFLAISREFLKHFPSVSFTDGIILEILKVATGESGNEGIIQNALYERSYDGKWSGEVLQTTEKRVLTCSIQSTLTTRVVHHSARSGEERVLKIVARKTDTIDTITSFDVFDVIVSYEGRPTLAHFYAFYQEYEGREKQELNTVDVELSEEQEEDYKRQGVIAS